MAAEPVHYLGTGCPSWAGPDAPGLAGTVAEVTCEDCRDALRALWQWSRPDGLDPWTGEPIASGSARKPASSLEPAPIPDQGPET